MDKRDDLTRPRAPSARPPEGRRRSGLPVSRLRDLPALLTASLAFEVLGVSASTGYEWIRAGRIPTVVVAGRRHVRLVDLCQSLLGISPEHLFGPDTERPA